MKRFNNFSLYAPDYSDDNDIPAGALFLRSEDGIDWYAAQSEFSATTLKVMFDSSGIICSAEVDASGMWPFDCSVIEIEPEDMPPGFACDGQWVWNGKTVSLRELSAAEILAKNEARKTTLMQAATDAIAPLGDADELGIATDEEAELLTRWKRYRVMLNRLDMSAAPSIDWPEIPE